MLFYNLIFLLYSLSLTLFCNGYIKNPSYILRNYNRLNNNHDSVIKIFALKEGSSEQLLKLKDEYDNLINKISENNNTLNDDEENRLNDLKVIFDCVKALKDIDRDLELFAEHENGNDESLKKTAKTFINEFLLCKEEIEGQLNTLL